MTKTAERRVRHLKQLEANHNKDFWDRLCRQEPDAGPMETDVAEARTEDRARTSTAADGAPAAPPPATPKRPLPRGWRNEHWKTQQAMAADYAGVRVKTKLEALRALEVHEAGGNPPQTA